MLQKLSDHIAYCHQRARKCAIEAENIDDAQARQAYLASERRWLMLATRYDIASRSANNSASQPIAMPHPHGVPRVMCPDCGERMRLRLVTPHPNKQRAETSTFECSCGHVYQQTVGRPRVSTAATATIRFTSAAASQGRIAKIRGNAFPRSAFVSSGTT